MRRFAGELLEGMMINPPRKDQVVQVFDVDSTLTKDPEHLPPIKSKDHYFDLARNFEANEAVAELARFLHSKGDAIAVATARPAERLLETMEWLQRNNIPVDQVMLSNGRTTSGIAKQEMLQKLQDDYKMVGTLFDDSPYNIEGARLQGVDGIHLRTNDAYWEAHPETVLKFPDDLRNRK